MARKQIAVFDHLFRRSNPIGSCQRRVVRALSSEHDVTVFAVDCDPAPPEGVRYVRVPAVRRPIALLYVTYHAGALLRYGFARMLRRERFDIVESSETYFSCARLRYAHFCHRAFLKLKPWPVRLNSLRGWGNFLDHLVQAAVEPISFRSSTAIVACSRGLAAEIVREYPFCRDKMHVIPNAVDLERMRRPEDFPRQEKRRELGYGDDDCVFVFVALGHFERKGLPILIEAVARTGLPPAKLLVVGGRDDMLAPYRRQADALGIAGQVKFVGVQADVRPLLWAADAFAFPSFYEAFSLASCEAAAASLPIIASLINGVDEFLHEGENGFVVTQSPESVAAAFAAFAKLPSEQRLAMGRAARRAVEPFGLERFNRDWQQLVRRIGPTSNDAPVAVHAHAPGE